MSTEKNKQKKSDILITVYGSLVKDKGLPPEIEQKRQEKWKNCRENVKKKKMEVEIETSKIS